MPNAPSRSNAPAALNCEDALVPAIELGAKSRVLAVQAPGLPKTKAKQAIAPTTEALMAAIDGYRRRAAAVGHTIERVITLYEAGHMTAPSCAVQSS